MPSAVISPGALDGNMDSLPGKENSATLSQKRRETDGEYSDSDNESTASIIEKSVSFQNSILKEPNRELRQQIKTLKEDVLQSKQPTNNGNTDDQNDTEDQTTYIIRNIYTSLHDNFKILFTELVIGCGSPCNNC